MTAAYDPLVVTLVVRGGHRMSLSRADRVAAVREFSRLGKSAREISQLLGISERHVLRMRDESMPPPDCETSVDYEFDSDAEELGSIAMDIVQAVRRRNLIEMPGACVDLSAWHPAKSAQFLCALAARLNQDEPPDVLARRSCEALTH